MELAIHQTLVPVDSFSQQESLREHITKRTASAGREDVEDPFYVVDLGRPIELYQDWVAAMPSVTPFYAVKCNEDLALLKTLAALGTGFDCASKHEMSVVLDLGVSPDRVMYANPCKQISHIQYAAQRGVKMMSFDNSAELHKTHKYFPAAELMLRIKADAPDCVGKPGFKFGCTIPGGKQLLDTAKALSLNVIGVSFHVGSRCLTPSAYEVALQTAAELFDYGAQIGYQFSLLDIGGGFPGHAGSREVLHSVASSINQTLASLFSPEAYPGVRVIAEPGRYFACSTHTIVVNIISKRVCEVAEGGEGPKFMYYINDGVYGSFNCVLNDRAAPVPTPVKEVDAIVHKTRLWGVTVAGKDKICDTLLPEFEVGDWLYFEDMGAYTISAATCFNGFPKAHPYYYARENIIDQLKQLHGQ